MVSELIWNFTLANNRKIYIIIFICSIAFCISCGTTHISCPDPNAEIYKDDEFLDRGEATISSMGPPNTAVFSARKNGIILGSVHVSRKFTLGTFGWGLISYYTGWYWGWYYPDEITILIRSESDTLKSPWDDPDESIWMKPIQKKK
jgi:hypothetical protein